MGFQRSWLKFYKNQPTGCNIYIICDPANSKKKESDLTSIWVIGLGSDKNFYILDGLRDRLNMKERQEAIFRLHREWNPNDVGYEKYGKDTDIEYLEEAMETESYRFTITALSGMNKYDRINNWLIPVYSDGRVWLPHHLFRTDCQGIRYDLIESFIEDEYDPYPVGMHPDMLDNLSRILDPELKCVWPRPLNPTRRRRKRPGWATV